MKKLLFLTLAVLSIFSCKPKDYLETLTKDTKEIGVIYLGAQLREVECVLTGYIDEAEKLEVESALQIYQVNAKFDSVPYVVFNGKTTETKDGIWVGSGDIDLSVIKLNFHQAFKRLHEVNMPIPHSNLVTLRIPLDGSGNMDPLYIFGSMKTFFVAVNSVTGEVTRFDSLNLGEIAKETVVDKPIE